MDYNSSKCHKYLGLFAAIFYNFKFINNLLEKNYCHFMFDNYPAQKLIFMNVGLIWYSRLWRVQTLEINENSVFLFNLRKLFKNQIVFQNTFSPKYR